MFLALWARGKPKRAPQRPREVPRASILTDFARFSDDFWTDFWASARHGGGKAVGNWITPDNNGEDDDHNEWRVFTGREEEWRGEERRRV